MDASLSVKRSLSLRDTLKEVKVQYAKTGDIVTAEIEIQSLRQESLRLARYAPDLCNLADAAELMMYFKDLGKDIDDFESKIKHDAKEPEPRWWPGVTEQQKQIFKSDLAQVIRPWNDGIDDEGRFKVKSRRTAWVLRALRCCGDLHLNPDVLQCFIDSKGKSFAEIRNTSDYVAVTKLSDYEKMEAIKALFEK